MTLVCHRCGYSLAGIEVGALCPECGGLGPTVSEDEVEAVRAVVWEEAKRFGTWPPSVWQGGVVGGPGRLRRVGNVDVLQVSAAEWRKQVLYWVTIPGVIVGPLMLLVSRQYHIGPGWIAGAVGFVAMFGLMMGAAAVRGMKGMAPRLEIDHEAGELRVAHRAAVKLADIRAVRCVTMLPATTRGTSWGGMAMVMLKVGGAYEVLRVEARRPRELAEDVAKAIGVEWSVVELGVMEKRW